MNRLGFIFATLFFMFAGKASANPLVFCDPLTGCPAAIAATQYQDKPAYALNNGVTTAVVVPEWGRVMSFGLSAKSTFDKSTFNWLWNNQSPNPEQTWKNWGGAKTWLAPQSAWPQIAGRQWPPDPAWTKVIKSEVLTGGILQTTSALAPHSGIQLVNQYGHDETGNFFIRQTAEKVSGKPLQMALWQVTQIQPPDGVFFVMDPQSTSSDSVISLQGTGTSIVDRRGAIGCYYPNTASPRKFGIKTQTPILAALYQNKLLVLRATPQNAVYPDATPAAPEGFSVEIFDSGPQEQRYMELEMLSPLRTAWLHSRWTFTVTWNIYSLSSSNIHSPELWKEVTEILM